MQLRVLDWLEALHPYQQCQFDRHLTNYRQLLRLLLLLLLEKIQCKEELELFTWALFVFDCQLLTQIVLLSLPSLPFPFSGSHSRESTTDCDRFTWAPSFLSLSFLLPQQYDQDGDVAGAGAVSPPPPSLYLVTRALHSPSARLFGNFACNLNVH